MTLPEAVKGDEWQQFLDLVQRALELNRRRFESSFRSKRYQSPAFDFVRRVRHHPLLRHLDAHKAAKRVDSALRELLPNGDRDLLWVELLGDSDSQGQQVDPFFDFIQAWDKCQQPGTGLLDIAHQRAFGDPRPADFFGVEFATTRYEALRTLLSTADELQQLRGDQNIMLPVLELEFLMGVSSQTISHLRRIAEDAGLLEKQSEYDSKLGLATEYRYTGPPFIGSFAPEKENQENHEIQEKDLHDLHEKDPQIPRSISSVREPS